MSFLGMGGGNTKDWPHVRKEYNVYCEIYSAKAIP